MDIDTCTLDFTLGRTLVFTIDQDKNVGLTLQPCWSFQEHVKTKIKAAYLPGATQIPNADDNNQIATIEEQLTMLSVRWKNRSGDQRRRARLARLLNSSQGTLQGAMAAETSSGVTPRARSMVKERKDSKDTPSNSLSQSQGAGQTEGGNL